MRTSNSLLSNTLSTSLLVLAVASVGFACDPGDGEPDPLERSSQFAPATPSASQQERQMGAEAPTPTPIVAAPEAPASQPAAFTADWNSELDAEISRVQSEAPEWFDALMSATPRQARSGTLRFVGPQFQDPNAAVVLLHRYVQGRSQANRDPAVQAALMEGLQRTDGDYALPLGELITQADDAIVRVAIVTALHRAKGEAALVGLEYGLEDSDASVRLAAIHTVGSRKDGATLGEQLIVALGDGDTRVQAAAAEAIGFLKVEGSAGDLTPLLSSEDADVRLRALQAMERVQPGAAASTTEFSALLADSDTTVARAAGRIAKP